MTEASNSALEKRIKKHVIGKPHRFMAVAPLGFEETLVKELKYIGVECFAENSGCGRAAPSCHSEAVAPSCHSEAAAPSCHSEERSDEESRKEENDYETKNTNACNFIVHHGVR